MGAESEAVRSDASPFRVACGLVLLTLLLAVGWASPVAAAPKPTGYTVDVQEEVMMQNLTCDDIEAFLLKPPEVLMSAVAGAVLNQPQHSRESSETLFGGQLTRLILTASNNPMASHPPCPRAAAGQVNACGPCTRIVPLLSPPDGRACDVVGMTTLEIVSRGMDVSEHAPAIHPGELTLLSMFEHAAKLKNCRRS